MEEVQYQGPFEMVSGLPDSNLTVWSG